MSSLPLDKIVPVGDPRDPALIQTLREQNISLKPNELERVRQLIGRDPTWVELHIFNVMWSEHCSYKSSKPVLRTLLPTTGPHVVLGPGEDAGIVRFWENGGVSHCLVVAHESHNHPSQVLPVEGAATGIGGIVRDVYCMGADVIGVMDPLRFGDPDGPHARRVGDIVRGVVEGIAQYGNALGVPNWGGETFFDASFDDNCLVNVVAVGVVEEGKIIRSRAPAAASREPHDIILIGKPTDASGFGGAAFASERLSGDAEEERQEAVQVPDPFLKRVLVEATKVVLDEARRDGVPIGFKDLGAGGISCAVSEMAQAAGVGATLDLERVNRAPDTLPPAVVACSETQERYAMIVPPAFSRRVEEIYNVEFAMPHLYSGAGAHVIGHTTADKRFRMLYGGFVICDADVDAITTGIEYDRAKKPRSALPRQRVPSEPAQSVENVLLDLMRLPNIADKSILFRHYDSEVQGRAVLRPGEADAAVALFEPGHPVGVAAGIGSNSAIGAVDPYLGGAWAVCEAVRNVACVGALPVAITDCLNYGDPEDPEVFWDFYEGVRGLGDACRGLRIVPGSAEGVPVISGNVSFYNQSGNGKPIAPTPIVACTGRVDDVAVCHDLGFKRPGSRVVLVGRLHARLGGSEYARRFHRDASFDAPTPDFALETVMVRAVVEGFTARLLLAAHDVSHGGLLVTISEMMLHAEPARVGCELSLPEVGGKGMPVTALFAEYGGIVVEVADGAWSLFRETLERHGAPHVVLGSTSASDHLVVAWEGGSVEVRREHLAAANRSGTRVQELFG